MMNEEIEQAVERALSGIEGNGVERASSAEWPEVEAEMALVERLGTFAKAAREIVQAVAQDSWYTHSSTLGGTLVQSCICVFCEEEAWPPHGSRDIPHQPDCLVTKARAILAEQPNETPGDRE